MTVSTTRLAGTALVIAAILASPLSAGDSKFQSGIGAAFFSASPPCPVKQFPTFESLTPIPTIIDPFAQDFIPMFCQLQVTRGGQGVKKAKGRFDTELVVLDHRSGQFDSFPIKNGRFKTNRDGIDSFDFDIPTELFADGFESGDVSAWSYTRSDFTNKKRSDNATVQCGVSASRSN